MSFRRFAAAWILLPVTMLSSARALGQGQDDKAAAETLFLEGRALQGQGRDREACEKFAASERLDASVGTLFNLADCHTKLERIASAWVDYREAIALATRLSDARRVAKATAAAAALEPRLSKVTVRLAEPAPPGLVLERDGEPLDLGALGAPLPVDPGEHTIAARAPGREPWIRSVTVTGEGAVVAVIVPPLALEPPPPPAAESPVPGRTARTAGIVLAAVGAAGLVTGVIFGSMATSGWSRASAACPSGLCPDTATLNATRPTWDSAHQEADVATAAFIVGGVGVAGGALLYFFLAPSRGPLHVTPSVGSRAAGIDLGGTF